MVVSAKWTFWLAVVALYVFAFACLADLELFPWSLVVETVALAWLFLRGERAIYPFKGRQLVDSRVGYFVFLLPMTLFTNTLANGPPLRWYPTPHGAWALLPIVLYAIAVVLRGFRWR